MSLLHAKSVTIAAFTGVVTVFNSVGSTATANATDLVLPPDWNSAHNQVITLAGNTNHAASVEGTNVVFSGGQGITLVGSGDTLGFSVGSYITTGMASNRGSDFVGAGAVFAGTNASGTIASDGLSISVGNYLTTAMASNKGTAFVQANANFAGTNASGTIASDGLSISIGNYLTTARASNDAIGLNTAKTNATWTVNSSGLSFDAGGYAGTGFTSATTAGVAIVGTNNTAGLSLGIPAMLTTAALSQDSSKYAGTAGAITGGSITVNTAGISVNLPAYLTTAGLSQDSSKYAGTNGAITGGSITVNTSGVSINLPAYLTTAMASNAATISNINVSAGATNNNLSAITFSNSNGLAFGLSGSTLTGSYTVPTVTNSSWSVSDSATSGTVGRLAFTNLNGVTLSLSSGAGGLHTIVGSHNAITTARGSTDAVGLNTALTANGVAWTVNSSGISLNVPAFLTTAMQSASSSVFAKTGFTTATTAGTAIVGTHNTDGLSMGVPAFLTTAMASNAATITAINVSASGTNNNLTAVVFSNSNAFTFGMSGSTITASYTVPTVTNSSWSVSDAATSGTVGRLAFTNLNGVTLSLSSGSGGSHTIVGSHNAITTGRASTDAVGLNTALTGNGVAWTVNSSGLSLNVPAFLTTAALSGDTTKYAGVGETVGTVAGTDLGLTVNTDGVSIAYPKWITTARASSDGVGLNTAKTNVTWTVNSSGISFDAGGYNGTGFTSTTTAGVAIVATNNTSGLSMGVPAFITTAGLSQDSSKYLQEWAFAGNNTAGTTSSAQGTRLYLSGGVGVTLSGNSNTIVMSAGNFASTFNGGISTGGNTSGSTGVVDARLVFVGGNGITLSGSTDAALHSATITVSGDGATISYLPLAPMLLANTVTTSFAQSTSHMIPFVVPNYLSAGSVRMFEVGSMAASSTQALVNGSTLSMTGATSHNFVFYSRGTGANSMSLQYVSSTQIVDQVSMNVQNAAGLNSSQLSYTLRYTIGNTSFTFDYSSTAQSYNFHTSGVTGITGTKQVDYPCGVFLSPGQWFLGYGRSTTFATQNAAISVATRQNVSFDSQLAISQATLGALGTLGGASSSSVMLGPVGLGSFTTGGAAGTTNSMNVSVISSGTSNQMPYFQLIRIA